MEKAQIQVVGWDSRVCRQVGDELARFFSGYVQVHTWCLRETPGRPAPACGLYLATGKSAADHAVGLLPPDSRLVVAQRSLNVKGIAKLLDLEKDARVLVAAASRSGALTTIQLIRQLGIDEPAMTPYYHGCAEAPLDGIDTALLTGQEMPLPSGIRRVVDLGPKGINLSTYVELLGHIPQAPLGLVNELAQSYITELFQAGLRQQKTARSNYLLRQELDVVLDTVDDGVVSVNGRDEITFFNKRACGLMGIAEDALAGKRASALPAALGAASLLEGNRPVDNKIRRLGDELFVLSYRPLPAAAGKRGGGVLCIRKAKDILAAEEKVRRKLFARGYLARHRFQDIAGASPALARAKELAERFSQAGLPILLEGETGTGKELFAQSIHNASPRRDNAFVAVNFAALAESLVESELFGYVDGAFTGARRDGQMGLFEQAHRGTIFLDEIGDVPLEIQKKLLRVLENQEVRRIGANMVTRVDVRIVAATNRSLVELVEAGAFRADLFYRLGTLPVAIPPLRERQEDIPVLLELFLRRYQKAPVHMDGPLRRFLLGYRWPGNVRELQNIAQYLSSLLPDGGVASVDDLPPYMAARTGPAPPSPAPFSAIARELERSSQLVPAYIALSELHQAASLGAGLGRNTLRSRLAERGYDRGEYPVKQLLSLLSALGLCHTGTTRQGTKILAKGESFRQYLSASGLQQFPSAAAFLASLPDDGR